MVTLGTAEYPYEVFDNWAQPPHGWSFKEDVFTRAHGITMGPDEAIFCTDDGDHTVHKCLLDGQVLCMLGVPDKPAQFMSGAPFNRCTHVAIAPRNGDFYVSLKPPHRFRPLHVLQTYEKNSKSSYISSSLSVSKGKDAVCSCTRA